MYYISQYFSEFRLRGSYCIFAYSSALGVSYLCKYELFYILSKPFLFYTNQFVFFDLAEALSTFLGISLSISFVAIFPLLGYHFWCLFVPGSYGFERTSLTSSVLLWSFCFLGEFFCAYKFFFPKICEFLVSFAFSHDYSLPFYPVEIAFTPRIASYIGTLRNFFFMFLLCCQIPFIFFYFFRENLVTPETFCQQRKFLVFVCILVAAFLSPPDFFSQCFLAFLFWILFESIIFFGFLGSFSKS